MTLDINVTRGVLLVVALVAIAVTLLDTIGKRWLRRYFQRKYIVVWDVRNDILHVKYRTERVHHSYEAPHDAYLIIDLSEENECVGLRIMDASGLIQAKKEETFSGSLIWTWKLHPDRDLVPRPLRNIVDAWVNQKRVFYASILNQSFYAPIADQPLDPQ